MGSAISLSEANSAFSLALFKQLSNNNKTGNIFFSPFSISSALAMVMLGARGNTATQMSECLQTGDCWGDVHSSFAKLLTELNRTDARFTFTVANRLYREKSCPFTQEFLIQARNITAQSWSLWTSRPGLKRSGLMSTTGCSNTHQVTSQRWWMKMI
ncbi:serpin B8-like [Oreochromis niloticus]|uniref:serpin B8-like n=1 Tax=Oreochromis niloticus TaxID=8128 RepID=UPI000DF2FCB6|nr:serpin B8-like [Oreochromis niloticus]